MKWGTPALPSDCYLGWVYYEEWVCERWKIGECGYAVKYKKTIYVNTNTHTRKPWGKCVRTRRERLFDMPQTFQCPKSRPYYKSSETYDGPILIEY